VTAPDGGDVNDPETQRGIEEGTISNPGGPPLGQQRFREQMINPDTGEAFTGDTESGSDAGGDGSDPQ